MSAPPPAAAVSPVRLLARHRGLLLVATALVLVGSAAGLLQPLLAGDIVELVRRGAPVGATVVQVTVLLVVQLLADTTGRYLLERAGHEVVRSARRSLVAHLLRLRMGALHRQRRADLTSRAGHDAGALHDLAARGLVDVVVGGLTAAGAVVLMVRVDAVLFAVVMGTFVVAGAGLALVLGRIRAASEGEHAAVGRLGADLDRVLAALRTVRVSGAQEAEIERLVRVVDDAYRAGLRSARLSAVASPAIQLAATGSFLLVLVVGGARVASGALELGALVTALLYATYVVVPLANVLEGLAEIQRAQGALARVRAALDLPVEPPPAPHRDHRLDHRLDPAPGTGTGRAPAAVPRPAPEPDVVRFDGVTFGYDRDAVVHELSFGLPAGSRTALVGPSGSGKSTVLALTCRFYEPWAGTLHYRGVPATDVPVEEARRLLALVEQDAPVTFDTVRDYLRLGRPGGDDAQLRAVLDRVNLLDWVDALEHGLDTVTGEGGANLSGGQRQRLAIARALLDPPALLLLDEPTSSLDRPNADAVADALAQLPDRCAVLVVTHRASALAGMDRVLVMDGGRVTASGRHPELLTTSATYRSLFGGPDPAARPVTGR